MNLSVLLMIFLGAAALALLVFWQKFNSAQKTLSETLKESSDLKNKLEAARKDLSNSKDELNRKAKALDEVRETAKKKLRKDAQKVAGMEQDLAEETDEEIIRLQKMIKALEIQLGATRSELTLAKGDAEKALAHEHQTELERVQTYTHKLEAELAKVKAELEAQKKPPHLAGVTLDLAALPADAVKELARFYRKAEHNEKLYGVSQGKLRLSQERFIEMQKKYFAVCRELALAVGSNPNTSDAEARNVAEEIVNKAENLTAEVSSDVANKENEHT